MTPQIAPSRRRSPRSRRSAAMSTQLESQSAEAPAGATELTYREAVTAALADEMTADPRVYLLGEDVANDGGVFKTNVGLPEQFPGRVTNTPICENTFIGLAIGMAVTGRSIGGGTGRFGTQHSATGESWFMAFPGLLVATAGTPGGAYSVLRAAIRHRDPVLFFEHKALY